MTGRPKQVKPAPTAAELSTADRQVLARLISMYGLDLIIEEAGRVRVGRARRRGRPLSAYYENMHLADWIDGWAELYRERGSQKPVKDAALTLYEMTVPKEAIEHYRMTVSEEKQREEGGHFGRWWKGVKKQRSQGLKDWAEVQERLALARRAKNCP